MKKIHDLHDVNMSEITYGLVTMIGCLSIEIRN